MKRGCARKQVVGASFGKNPVRRIEATGQGESGSKDSQAGFLHRLALGQLHPKDL